MTSADFAGMLAGFAGSEAKLRTSADLDGLEDDVATLSYESALRSLERVAAKAATLPDAHRTEAVEEPAWEFPLDAQKTSVPTGPAAEAERKSASVTVRISQTENELLRKRAAEAGMTISAYLRSCAFEVESLRAQVKETVAQMKAAAIITAASQVDEPAAPKPAAPKKETAKVKVPAPAQTKQSWWSRFTPPVLHRTAAA